MLISKINQFSIHVLKRVISKLLIKCSFLMCVCVSYTFNIFDAIKFCQNIATGKDHELEIRSLFDLSVPSTGFCDTETMDYSRGFCEPEPRQCIHIKCLPKCLELNRITINYIASAMFFPNPTVCLLSPQTG